MSVSSGIRQCLNRGLKIPQKEELLKKKEYFWKAGFRGLLGSKLYYDLKKQLFIMNLNYEFEKQVFIKKTVEVGQ